MHPPSTVDSMPPPLPYNNPSQGHSQHPTMESIVMHGSIFRIKQCALDLISMEEDLINSDDEIVDKTSWEMMGSSLRLKSTFLFFDLNGVINGIHDNRLKESLTLLANQLLLFMDELCCAARSRDRPSMRRCCNEAIVMLEEVAGVLLPPFPTHSIV